MLTILGRLSGVIIYNNVKNKSKGGIIMRRKYLDNIRWVTILIVIIYHVIYMFNGVTTYGVIGPFSEDQPQDIFLYIVYPWFMFLLFVVSGMAARFELDHKGESGFIRNRTRKYLVPSTIGLFVFWWILGYYNMLIGGAFESMGTVPKPVLYLIMCISGIGPLWYIQMLWLFSLILIWIRKIEKDRVYNLAAKTNVFIIVLLGIAVYGAAQVLNTPIVVVYRFGIYGLGFLLGYFIFSHEEVMEKLEKYWMLFGLLALAFCILFLVFNLGKPYPEHEVLDTFLCNMYAWFGTLGLLAFMKKWGDFHNGFSDWMCRKSWGLYVFHYLGIAISSWYIKMYLPQIPVFFVYLLVLVSGIAGALLLYEIISRIPVLRWCVLGIKHNK
ncbi:MAG: acyltransferase [Lachnospiraceae bacterium]|jgi:peptidoglycan/LPS O-acetylase OafA/YrhL|nr:acyltransferase [Lachnospiraceae bacterium]MDY3301024.1 acyltransferase [Lachnospiraceae bacterium]MEE3379655.1 acyltransferase [Lachnospiraceae bacterium]MEE3432531.1 acyltransferase [Lachnospiraceae bacterium]